MDYLDVVIVIMSTYHKQKEFNNKQTKNNCKSIDVKHPVTHKNPLKRCVYKVKVSGFAKSKYLKNNKKMRSK